MKQKQQLEKIKSDIENFFHALELAKRNGIVSLFFVLLGGIAQ